MEGVGNTVMIGVLDYSVVIGRRVRKIEEIVPFYDVNGLEKMHEIGLSKVPTDNQRPLFDMIDDAYSNIRQHPDCILIAHSLPFIRKTDGDFHHDKSIPVFYLSGLPCSIMHKAVEIACKLIRAQIFGKVLVIGADKAYSDAERVFFGTIMGDGVVAVLLGESAQRHQILSSEISTTIIAPDGENSSEEDILRFRSMNASMMRGAIERCKKKAGITEIDHFVTHTSNRTFWDTMAILIKCPREKIMDNNIKNTGHMNSHDSFLHYFYYYEQGKIKKGETVMLINPGFGGTQGCTLIRV